MSQILAAEPTAEPAPVEDTLTCPVCESGAVNVQGRFTCSTCDWAR